MGFFSKLMGKEIKEYHSNGKLKLQCFEKRNGQLEGRYSAYYNNGRKAMEWNYIDGIINSIIKTWYTNGNKSSEGTITENRFTGNISTWYTNGKIQSEIDLTYSHDNFLNIDPTHPLFKSVNGSHGSNKPVWFTENKGMFIKPEISDEGWWYSENGEREKLSIQEIHNRNKNYIDLLEKDETSVYCDDEPI